MIDLRLGDCLEVMATLPDGCVDAVITDPPYGVGIADWDSEVPPQSVLDECLRVARGPVVWFGAASPRVVSAVMDYSPLPDRIIMWHVTFTLSKTSAHGMFYRWHPIYIWRAPKKQDAINFDIIQIPQDGRNPWKHPGTKPIKLMRVLVEAFGGDSAVDPFMGSGTTGVACIETGRNFIGIEKQEDYFTIASQRIEAAAASLRQLELAV